MTRSAPHSYTQQDLDAAFHDGVAAAERELLPFEDVGRVRFPRGPSMFDNVVRFERELLRYQRDVRYLVEDAQLAEASSADLEIAANQDARDRVAQAQACGSNPVITSARRLLAHVQTAPVAREAHEHAVDARATLRHAEDLADRVAATLRAVREWLDAESERVEQFAATRAGMRRETQVLPNAIAYSRQAFYDEDRAGRELGIHPGANVPGGAFYADFWTWELPNRPWEVTRWALYWLDNGEIFAVDATFSGDPDLRPVRDPEQEILLLGRVPRPASSLADDFLADVERSVHRDERNTLVVAAQAIADRQRAHEREQRLANSE